MGMVTECFWRLETFLENIAHSWVQTMYVLEYRYGTEYVNFDMHVLGSS